MKFYDVHREAQSMAGLPRMGEQVTIGGIPITVSACTPEQVVGYSDESWHPIFANHGEYERTAEK